MIIPCGAQYSAIVAVGIKDTLLYGGRRGTRTPDPLGVNQML